MPQSSVHNCIIYIYGIVCEIVIACVFVIAFALVFVFVFVFVFVLVTFHIRNEIPAAGRLGSLNNLP